MDRASCAGIILAAGRGSRLGAHTEQQPKCLIRIDRTTLIEWATRALRANGIHRLAVVRGYLAESIKLEGLHFFDNPFWYETNMVASLICARDWLLKQPCIVSYGDILYHPDLVKTLLEQPGDIVLVYDDLWHGLWRDRFNDPGVDAESFAVRNGTVVDIGRKGTPLDLIEGQFIGLFKTTPQGWSDIENLLTKIDPATVKSLDTTTLLQKLIEGGVAVHGVPFSGRWCEVDSEKDLKLYERKLNSSEQWPHDWRF